MVERIIPKIPVHRHLDLPAFHRADIIDHALHEQKGYIQRGKYLYTVQRHLPDKVIQRISVEQRIAGVHRAGYRAEQNHKDDFHPVLFQIRKQPGDAEEGEAYLFLIVLNFSHQSPPSYNPDRLPRHLLPHQSPPSAAHKSCDTDRPSQAAPRAYPALESCPDQGQ